MNKGMVLGLAILLAGAGVAVGQPPTPGPEVTLPLPAPEPAAAPPADGFAVEDDTPAAGQEVAPVGTPAAEPAGRFWVSGEYLLWWIKDSHYPPLLTSGSPTDALPGALGMPGTQVLFGGNVDNQERSGAHLTGGFWLDDEHRWGVEGGYLFLGSRTIGANNGSPGVPGTGVTARPFFDVGTNSENASLEAYPGLAGGGVFITTSSEFQAAEANVVFGLSDGPHLRLEVLGGLRYVHLDERLGIKEDVEVNATASSLAGDHINVVDRFDTTNDFYGAQVGARAALRFERWEATVVAKVALGDAHQTVDIGGATAIAAPGQLPTVFNGGLLALPSNSGTFQRDTFAVVPEVGIRVDYRFTKGLRAFVGYSLLYWSDVARPGDQIDRGIDVTQVPTSKTFVAGAPAARPAFSFNSTDFWAQGVSFGMEFRY